MQQIPRTIVRVHFLLRGVAVFGAQAQMKNSAYDLANPRPRRRKGSGRKYSRHGRELLRFFVRHRTALASHVERVFPDRFRNGRTTRLHLQTLVEAGELAVAPRAHLSGPNVYLLAPRGLANWLELSGETPVTDTPARRRRPNGSHLLHELLITEFAVSILEAVRARQDLSICWDERFELVARPAFQDLVPDYSFHFRVANGAQLICLAEISAGEDSPRKLATKLDKYVRWLASDVAKNFLLQSYKAQGAQTPQPVFRLLFIVHNRRGTDNARLRQLLREVSSQNEALRARIWATTVENLATANAILQPVWIRARDLVSTSNARSSVKIASLPRHRLFPEE